MANAASNKFCKLRNLHNESDVEQNLIVPLLEELGFTEDYRLSKSKIAPKAIGKGRNRKNYVPDFLGYLDKGRKKPTLVIDAKGPTVEVETGVEDAQLYASVIRRGLTGQVREKPEQYCIGVNGTRLVVKHYDSDEALYDLGFEDFEDGNPEFEQFKAHMCRASLRVRPKPVGERAPRFEFTKPKVSDLTAIFETCHNLIWKKEKMPPAEAFYEFAKILFVKLRLDAEIHARLAKDAESVTAGDFKFSVRWLESLESADANPVDNILFRKIRDDLEEEIQAGRKKRIFLAHERITLGASTIKEVVRLLEHHDLHGMDEDLNGRMFETFLAAVIRGRALGQFFTPRSVVKFMVDTAEPMVRKDSVPAIIDACCGTGGFLIEAMARLVGQVKGNQSLTQAEKTGLLRKIMRDSLWGVEANELITRVARMNMYLHQDGGSRIYRADPLDKELVPETNLAGESKRDFDEVRAALLGQQVKFDIGLTNPPFAMRYESRKKDEARILRGYELAKKPGTAKLVSSLRSSIMFLERYYDLLRDGGYLLTIIDESVLNTSTTKLVRDWLRRRFVLRAVVSLPKNTFVVAGSASKTSVLVLQKKPSRSTEQPDVFMAKSRSVGHADSGKPEPESNDLQAILAEWRQWRTSGRVPSDGNCFIVKAGLIGDRLDVQWYDPEYGALYKQLEKVSHRRIGDLGATLRYGGSIDADYKSNIPFLRIENLRRNDIDVSDLQYVPSAVYARQLKNLYLREGDILIARSGTYVGLCAHVPSGFEGFTYGSYIIRLRLEPDSEILPQFLVVYLNSRFGQMQFDRLKTGSLQFNINKEQIKDVIVPLLGKDAQLRIVEDFRKKFSDIKDTKNRLRTMEGELADGLATRIKDAAGIKAALKLRDFEG